MSVLNRLHFSGVLNCSRTLVLFPRSLLRHHQTKPKNSVTSYFIDKYIIFIKRIEKNLSKNFPKAMNIYNVYSVGIKLFKDDVIILYKGFKKSSSEGWDSLSRKELEICYQMPQDIIRISPVLLGTLIPFCGVLFVLAFYFPRQLLTHHFWSSEQRNEFSLISHSKKLQLFKPVLDSMQKQLISLNESDPLHQPMKQILESLESGIYPSVDLILECKPLFKTHYDLSNLSSSHIVALLKVYNLHRGWKRKRRLEFRASLISLIDKAIVREGGFEKLSEDEIKWNCFLRGLNPNNMRQEDIFKWINTWLEISQEIDKNSLSLLLHCPVLLGYNQPSNCELFCNKR